MKKIKNTYLQLFISTFYISAFTFGGGYVIIPLLKQKFSDELGWVEENEMLNISAIAQSAPGAVAVNASIMLGYKIRGMLGALVAIIGTILPPFIILSVISYFYEAFMSNAIVAAVLLGMQAGVGAVVVNVVIDMSQKILQSKELVPIFVMFLAFFATYFFKLNPAIIILACGIIGAISAVVKARHKGAEK